MAEWAIGIDLGGTAIKALALSAEGERLGEEEAATRDGEFEDGVPAFAVGARQLVEGLEERHGGRAAVGICAPGLPSKDGDCIRAMPGRLEGLEGLVWKEALGREGPVPVLNDAHAALYGEAWKGAAAGLSDVMMLTLGTGVGGALMVDGRLLRGHLGRAGHLGHVSLDGEGPLGITGLPGTIEETLSRTALERSFAGRWEDVEALLESARDGDEAAVSIWRGALDRFARGLASLINVADPEAIVLGGGIAQAGDMLFGPLQEFLDTYEWRPTGEGVRLLAAELGSFAGAYGAARMALETDHG